ncbi:hypothetical protein Hdeb2414_s0016g00483271 [Helianthus debilis subsp. tardiflorus]
MNDLSQHQSCIFTIGPFFRIIKCTKTSNLENKQHLFFVPVLQQLRVNSLFRILTSHHISQPFHHIHLSSRLKKPIRRKLPHHQNRQHYPKTINITLIRKLQRLMILRRNIT